MIEQPNTIINPSDTTGITCSNCNGFFFEQALMIRKTSRFLTGNSTDDFGIVPAFRCQDCGEVLKELFPSGFTDVEEALGLNKKETQTKGVILNG